MKHNDSRQIDLIRACGKGVIAAGHETPVPFRFFGVWSAFLVVTLVFTSAGFGAEPLAVSAPAGSNTTVRATNAGPPAIRFANPIFDFGKVETGQAIQHDFWFTNTGQNLLEIRDVRPSCGCTLAANWDRSVQPGMSGRVPIHLNYGNFSGDLHKTVIVVCNDPAQSNFVLQVKGTIWKAIDIQPAFVVFTPAPDSLVPDLRVVKILNNTGEPLSLSEPECTNQAFQATLNPLMRGKEFELKVAFLPPFRPGTVTTLISLKTSRQKTPVLTLSVCGVVQPAVTAQPSQLTLPPGPLTAAITLKVTIQNHSTKPLTLSDPVVSVEGVGTQLQEVEPGRTFQLAIAFPEGFRTPSSQKVEAEVKTSSPLLSVLRIPVLQGQSLSAALSARSPSEQAGTALAAPGAN